ncbi:calcium-binding protein [Jannaschia marina]|uniref:calcium-binding protein n=1 Tax=Jannaschia marina TaxID=2741674 RepID=UPI0015CB7200|nr:calcium-binding protein [Jannaschia marina]
MSQPSQPLNPTLVGGWQNDVLDGGSGIDHMVGLAGDDTLSGGAGADLILGDSLSVDLLQSPEGALTLDQYAEGGAWTVGLDADGLQQMSQTVETVAGASYEIAFELAANITRGGSGTVDVLWNGEVIGEVTTGSGAFSEAAVTLTGTGEPGELTLRLRPDADPAYDTSGPIASYATTVTLNGEPVEVAAFAPGQPAIYQVMNGRLQVFDTEAQSYTAAGAEATVVANAIGFNQEDDLIYGIAVRDGVDALGQAVTQSDLVMYDADGNAYRVGSTPYRSWTGDFDDRGNLWAFEADFDRVTMIDVDTRDADGNPLARTFRFPVDMIADKVWDVGFDAESQCFYGLVKPDGEGGAAKLIRIDISAVAEGGEPVFTTIPVTGTMIDGTLVEGAPDITFGAFVVDGEGNLYAGGNGGDHDMNDATGRTGGIYRVERLDDGTARLELVSDAPPAYSNDGAMDPRAIDPFATLDPDATLLIRGVGLHEVEDANRSYDDLVEAGAGADEVHGGFGSDALIGASAGDHLQGDAGDDVLYGGAGPGSISTIVSVYDDAGLRYDQHGNLLEEDDDVLAGGSGDDLLDGSAGHDVLDGGAGADVLSGGSGHDILRGGSGDDALSGGREDDALSGGSGDDVLDGGSGDDDLAGDAGRDVLSGQSGDDLLSGGAGADTLDGGSGADTLDGGTGADRLDGGSGGDQLSGGEAADVIAGGSGADVIDGGAGDDRIRSGSGADRIEGGEGRDYINASSGDDVISGGAGRDKIYLGAGADLASGGAGSDTFVFRDEDMDGSVDRITDLTRDGAEADRLDLRKLDLLGGLAEAEWIAANVSLNGAGDAVVDLGGATLICEAGAADDIYQTVVDAFVF